MVKDIDIVRLDSESINMLHMLWLSAKSDNVHNGEIFRAGKFSDDVKDLSKALDKLNQIWSKLPQNSKTFLLDEAVLHDKGSKGTFFQPLPNIDVGDGHSSYDPTKTTRKLEEKLFQLSEGIEICKKLGARKGREWQYAREVFIDAVLEYWVKQTHKEPTFSKSQHEYGKKGTVHLYCCNVIDEVAKLSKNSFSEEYLEDLLNMKESLHSLIPDGIKRRKEKGASNRP